MLLELSYTELILFVAVDILFCLTSVTCAIHLCLDSIAETLVPSC